MEKRGTTIDGLGLMAVGRAFAAMRTEDPEGPGADPEAPRLDGYVLTERLGSGGGGVVYKGYREGSDRALAIKFIRQTGAQQGASRRAWRELEVLMQIRLPSVPRVIDYGWAGRSLYIASEFVDGLPLDRHCEGRALDRRARVELLALVADAVQSLHEQGVIHRDIKPSNILIDHAGHPVIIDLGIATLLTHDVMATLTAEGAPIGSPAFMAPEQARGDREKISTRTDVYGLGATAFLILTGTTPYDTGSTIHEVVRRIAEDPARRSRDLEPTLPIALAAVLDKAVAARPEDRYPGAAALSAEFRRWLRGEPVLAGPPGPWSAVLKWIARHPAGATAAVCVSIAVLVMGGTAIATWWLNMRPHHLAANSGARTIELRSRWGRTLHQWESDGEFMGWRLLDRPAELGGDRIALLGINPRPEDDPRRRGLCAFSLEDPATALWASGSEAPEIQMPPHPGFDVPQRFVLRGNYRIEDVFPELPGPEIVAVHGHVTWSATAVRVYDLAGAVRYEAWHDGFIEAHWLPDPGLLVCAGVNSEVLWRGRGWVGASKAYPMIVCALRPRDGARAGWVTTPSREGTCRPEWYRCLLPPAATDVFEPLGAPEHGGVGRPVAWDPRRYVDMHLQADEGRFITLLLDGAGTIVEASMSAEYGQDMESAGLPDPRVFTLGDLPPIVQSDEQSRPRNR